MGYPRPSIEGGLFFCVQIYGIVVKKTTWFFVREGINVDVVKILEIIILVMTAIKLALEIKKIK